MPLDVRRACTDGRSAVAYGAIKTGIQTQIALIRFCAKQELGIGVPTKHGFCPESPPGKPSLPMDRQYIWIQRQHMPMFPA